MSVIDSGDFPQGASWASGSRKYPTERDTGQSWVWVPPRRIPGRNRSEVPVYEISR